MTLAQLNNLSDSDVRASLLQCCGSERWVDRVAAARPFKDSEHLYRLADQTWWALDSKDWLEAFSKHPRIGETRTVSTWSQQEQSGMSESSYQTAQKLQSLNEEYLGKFGWIYIVCATGKSAEEMLAILKSRISNDSAQELRIAAGEQAKITQLRIGKLLAV